MFRSGLGRGDARVILAAVGSTAAAHEIERMGAGPPPPPPFVTISCEPGIGGMQLAQSVVQRLNLVTPAGQEWTCWDRELVEKVAADYSLNKHVLESLEESDHSWLNEFLSSLTLVSGPSDESVVFRHVATTVRVLARGGRVVLVGRGSVYLTHAVPGGIHVRVIAPFKQRAEKLGAELNIPIYGAEAELRRREHNQHLFFKRYFSKQTLETEAFTATFNAGLTDEAHIAAAISALVPDGVPASPISAHLTARTS